MSSKDELEATGINTHRVEPVFIVIGGLPIDLDDLLAAIEGRDYSPRLTPAELVTATRTDDREAFYELPAEARKRRLRGMTEQKKLRISNLIASSTRGASLHLPRREQILIALSGGKLNFNTFTEFIGQFAGLDEGSVQDVQRAVVETSGGVLLEARPANQATSRRISESLDSVSTRLVEAILGELDKSVPVFLLERAAFECPPTLDDFQYFGEMSGDRSIQSDFTFESALSTTALALPALVATGSVFAGVLGWVDVERANEVFETALKFTVGGAALKVTSYFSGWSPITDLIRSHRHTAAQLSGAKHLKDAYTQMEKKVEHLKKTGYGSLQVLMLRQIILSSRERSSVGHQVTVSVWLTELDQDPLLKEQFENFYGLKSGGEWGTIEQATAAWEEFQKYRQALTEIEPRTERDPQPVKRTTGSVRFRTKVST